MKKHPQRFVGLLLACMILISGSQAALCEIACGHRRGVSCHDSTVSSVHGTNTAPGAMPGMECSGGTAAVAHTSEGSREASGGQLEGRDIGCRHPVTVAMVDSATSSDNDADVHWIVISTTQPQHFISCSTPLSGVTAAPLTYSANQLRLTLRV